MKKIGLLLSFVLFYTANITAQNSISGKVQDKDGNPLAGATVKSKTDATKTNETGSFSIKAKAGETLYISYVGMALNTVKAAESMLVSMVTNTKSETEVIVTGYSTKSKRANTGSASTVTIDDVRSQPIASFDQLLQGQAPGLKAISNSGQPGAAAQVIIRGRGSIAASVNPLYILDGMEITPQDFATLNQGDFESITVLKDAVTAGIYGSRASNGVIVITSRRGKAGKTKFNYDFQVGQSKFPSNKLKLMNTQEKLDYEKVNGNPNGWTPSEFDSLSKINTDWEKVFFRTGQTQSHQLSASGGSDKTRFYTSLGYLNQTGTVQATALKRYTVRLNLESGTERVKFGINTSVGYSEYSNTQENNQGIASPLNALRWTLPYFTPKDAKGNYVKDPTSSGQPNALQELLDNKRQFPQVKAVGNVFGEYSLPFIKGLSIRSTVGIDYRNDQQTIFSPSTTYIGSLAPAGKGSLFKSTANSYRITNTNSINYKKNIKNIHDITVFVAQEYILRKAQSYNFTGYGFTEPYFENVAGSTPGNTTNNFIPLVGGNGSERRLNSYFMDAGYSYKNKIFGNFNIRKDISSVFLGSKKSALLGGVGAAWILSEESFLRNSQFLNFLKVKASYGSTGNQEVFSDFAAISNIGKTSYNGQNGYVVTTLGNPELTWETRKTANFGLDFAFWKNRIKGGVEYYNSITDGLYNFEKVPLTSGFSNRITNNGKLRNTGIELNLSVNLLNFKSFSWTVSGNFTYNKNQVTELPDGQLETPDANGLTVTKVGAPLLSFKLNEYLGVDPATGKSIYRNSTGGKTNTYSPGDAIVFGTSDAPYFGGITNTFEYKGLQLSIFWTYAFGNEIYNNDRSNVENPSYIASSISRDLLREWRNPGDITDIPSSKSSIDEYQSLTTRYLENGSFWRLRNVELAYNLPKRWMDKAKLNAVRVFVQGQNLVTITKFRGFDPEITNPSLGGAQYPTLRSVTAGLNIGF
jgi:TonB-dependent starch-binding outer membrane protein SusC